jgi:hypothetical protein
MRAPLLLLALSACAPPDAPQAVGDATGEPSIQIVYPPSDTATIAKDADGTLRFTVVVDIEGFDFVPPGTQPDLPDVVEGQGHWHLLLSPSSFYAPPADVYYDAEVTGIDPGVYRIQAVLQNNNHTEVGCDTCEDALEITVTEFDGGSDTDGF